MVNTTTSRGDTPYNPQSDADFDKAAFESEAQPTNRAEGGQSGQIGSIPQGEVENLKASQFPGEGEVEGYTRGNQVDAYKNEREIDSSFKAAGIPTDDDAEGEEY